MHISDAHFLSSTHRPNPWMKLFFLGLEKVERHVADALDGGAELVTGGDGTSAATRSSSRRCCRVSRHRWR